MEKQHSIKLKSIFEEAKIEDEDDLYNRLLNVILESLALKETLDLKEFEDEIPKKKMTIINSKIKEYIDEAILNSAEQVEDNLSFEIAPKLDIATTNELKNVNEFLVKSLADLEFKIPECLEKFLLELVYHLRVVINDSNQSVEKIHKSLTSVYNRLSIEFPENKDFNLIYCQIRNQIEFEDWKSALELLNQFIKKLQPFDIFEMENLINKSKKTSDLLKNQDVILLLGYTGSGKSTLVHFLSGSKLVKEKIEMKPGHFLEHITTNQPGKNINLNSVKISYKAESETRIITPVKVNLKDIGGYEKKDVIICDTPGLGDTAGAEVDIANAISIIEAIRSCKSVKPVILVNYLDFGGRGDRIREIAHFFVHLIKNIEDHLSSFSYFFTKFPPGKNVHSELLNIKESMDRTNESEDKSLEAFFMDMIEKTEDSPNCLDLFAEKPLRLLKRLLNTASIQNPDKVFKFSITEKSRNTLNEQANQHKLSIIAATKRNDFLLIKFKLEQLKFLSEILKNAHIKHIYEDCLNYVLRCVTEKNAIIVEGLNSCLEVNNKLSKELIYSYKMAIDYFKDLKYFENLDALNEIKSLSETLRQNLINQIRQLIEKQKACALSSSDIQTSLNNIKLIVENFSDLNTYYDKACNLLFERLKDLSEETVKSLLNSKYDNTSKKACLLLKSLRLYKEHMKKSEEKLLIDGLVGILKEYLKEQFTNIEYTLRRNKLNSEEIECIKKSLNILENCKKCKGIDELVSKDYLSETFSSSLKLLTNYFDTIIDTIKSVLDSNNENLTRSFEEIKELFRKMKMIHQIESVEIRTSETYHSVIQKLKTHMNQMRLDTEQMLAHLNKDISSVNMKKLYLNLINLKRFNWINDYEENAYEKVIENIRDNLVKHSVSIHDELMDCNITLKNSDDLQKAHECVKQQLNLKSFEEVIIDLKMFIDASCKAFNDSFESIFFIIESSFNLEKHSINRKKDEFAKLKEIKIKYDNFCLKKQGNQNENEMNELNITLKTGKCLMMPKICLIVNP